MSQGLFCVLSQTKFNTDDYFYDSYEVYGWPLLDNHFFNMPHFSETGPRALVVLLSTFLIKVVIYGISMSIGLYTVEFLKYFDTSAAYISLVGAIIMGVFRMGGPVISLFMQKFSHRFVLITGGILSTVGILSMVFVNDIGTLSVTYGLFAGLGFSACYIASNVLVGEYFKKYRVQACAITEGGSGLGITVFPMFVNFLIDEYAWKGSLFIISGVSLNLVVLGALCRCPPCFAVTQSSINVPDILSSKINNVTETTQGMSISQEDIDGSRQTAMVDYKQDPENCEILRPIRNKCSMSNETVPLNIVEGVFQNNQQTAESKKRKTIKYFVERYQRIFSNLDFVLFALSHSFYAFTLSLFYNFAPAFFVSIGISESDAAQLLTLSSVMYCPFTIVVGILGSTRFVKRKNLYTAANIVLAVTILLNNYLNTFSSFIALVIVFGGAMASVSGLVVNILIDLVGTPELPEAFGSLSMLGGIGFLAGPVVAGHLYDVTGSFEAMFNCTFGVQCLAVFIMLIILARKKFSHRSYK